jgi:signal transduction histidine kinase
MDFIFALICLALCLSILIVFRRNKQNVSVNHQNQSQSIPYLMASRPQDPSCLEDKLWYESELNFLFKFSEKLISAVGYHDIVECIADAAYNFLPVERAVFLTWDKNTETFTIESAIGWRHDRASGPVTLGKESISAYVIGNRDVLVVTDLSKQQYLGKINKEEYLRDSFISAPLMYKNEVLGVLHVSGKKTARPFTQRDVSVVKNIVRMGAITLQNAQLYEQTSRRADELKAAYDKLKDMQDKLIQSEKLKAIGQLASGVVHEMRNPMGIIMQGVGYLEQVLSLDDLDQRETLSMIKASTQRADRIVISLLDYSRATKLELHPEYVGPILENALNLVKTDLMNFEVIREIQENLPRVSVDKNKLTQVFINLFINAIHAMPQGGRLMVRSFAQHLESAEGRGRATENVVVVEIEDTGIGIPPEDLKRIFDPFFTTKGSGKGTGLGLSISQNIIVMHKGQIEIESQVKKGTKVIITLRIAKEEEMHG